MTESLNAAMMAFNRRSNRPTIKLAGYYLLFNFLFFSWPVGKYFCELGLGWVFGFGGVVGTLQSQPSGDALLSEGTSVFIGRPLNNV